MLPNRLRTRRCFSCKTSYEQRYLARCGRCKRYNCHDCLEEQPGGEQRVCLACRNREMKAAMRQPCDYCGVLGETGAMVNCIRCGTGLCPECVSGGMDWEPLCGECLGRYE